MAAPRIHLENWSDTAAQPNSFLIWCVLKVADMFVAGKLPLYLGILTFQLTKERLHSWIRKSLNVAMN